MPEATSKQERMTSTVSSGTSQEYPMLDTAITKDYFGMLHMLFD